MSAATRIVNMRAVMLEFHDRLESGQAIREALGEPSPRVLAKVSTVLDAQCVAFIRQSPFLMIASSDAAGHLDLSPRGDPAGFVHVLDDTTLALPDRPGNRRGDTLRNIVQRPEVALIFLIPGNGETLRVAGSALVVRDEWLRARMAVAGKAPALVVVVRVREAFFHCPKSFVRSQLWSAQTWPSPDAVAGPRIPVREPLY